MSKKKQDEKMVLALAVTESAWNKNAAMIDLASQWARGEVDPLQEPYDGSWWYGEVFFMFCGGLQFRESDLESEKTLGSTRRLKGWLPNHPGPFNNHGSKYTFRAFKGPGDMIRALAERENKLLKEYQEKLDQCQANLDKLKEVVIGAN